MLGGRTASGFASRSIAMGCALLLKGIWASLMVQAGTFSDAPLWEL